MEISVVVQHRHVHLCANDAETLFGTSKLSAGREIEHRGQFVATQTLEVQGPKGSFSQVCIVGPTRVQTQVELSSSDAFAIGVNAPLRLSGDVDRSATVLLKTAQGEIRATMSTIIPIRHLHLPPSIAESLGLAHHEITTVRLRNDERVVFDQVVVRVHPTFSPVLHLTKDEAAPAWIQTGDIVIL